MDYNTIEQRLATLFSEWRVRMKQDGHKYFTEDGIIYKNNLPEQYTLKLWCKSQKRVVFLLKDQNQGNGERWDEDIRYWLIGEDKNRIKNRDLSTPFLKILGYMLWGVCKVNNDCDWWYNEVTKHIDEVIEYFNTQPFGLIECKKEPGGCKCPIKELRYHLERYGDLLKREIEILNPNIIVCTHHLIYGKVRTFYRKDELEEYVVEGGGRLSYHSTSGTVIALGSHPSSRRKKEGIYEDLMWPYRNFIKNRKIF